MDLDTEANRARLIKFGNLSTDGNFHVISPETGAYNCIAWAMGFVDRWVDYIPSNSQHKKWWPKGISRSFMPDDLVSAFEAVGFEKCDDDNDEEGYEKVALYKRSPYTDPISKEIKAEGWTHAARVLSKDVYHSKMGPSFDIHHSSGDVFDGTNYGEVFQFMKRLKSERQSILDRVANEEPRLSLSNQQFEELVAFVKASGVVIKKQK